VREREREREREIFKLTLHKVTPAAENGLDAALERRGDEVAEVLESLTLLLIDEISLRSASE
jgi:hypothetical protein